MSAWDWARSLYFALKLRIAFGAVVQCDEGLDRVGMAPDVVECVAGGAAKFRDVVVEPLGAAIDGFVDVGPVFFGKLWLGFDERHDDERSDGRVEGVVGAGGRGVDVQALACVRGCPRSRRVVDRRGGI